MESDRILTSGVHREDGDIETSLRPRTLRDYVGQASIKDSLSIYIKAALERRDALDHMLLYGPPGLGKTTLACIVAAEMGQNVRITSGPRSTGPATWPPYSPTLTPAMCFSLTRSTGCRARWRRCSIPRWRTARWIL